MKIAMFADCYYPRVNGVVVSMHSFAQELINRGHVVKIMTVEYPDDYEFGKSIDENYGIIDSPNFSIERLSSKMIIFSREDRLLRFRSWFAIKQIMDKFCPDIIHINSEWLVGYFGVMYARHRNKPCIFTFHTMWEDYIKNYAPFVMETVSRKIGRDLVKFYLKRADYVLAPTPRIAEKVREYGVETKPALLPTGIASCDFQIEEERCDRVREKLIERFPNLQNKKILLFAGRVAKEKNIPFLLSVLKNVNRRLPEQQKAVLLIAGDGVFLPELTTLIHEQGLEKDIFCLGYVEHQYLAYLYSLADVFTFPSKTETQGLVTLEAMTMGLPVVAIGELGTKDVMQGDNGGFMVPDDVSIFSDRVYQLLTDSELHAAKSREAKEWSKQWSIESLTDKLLEAYKQTIWVHRQAHSW